MSQTLLVDCLKIISNSQFNQDWLQDRHKLPKDWYNYEKAAQQNIKDLLKDQNNYIEQVDVYDFIKQHSENFHYCDVSQLMHLLLKTKWAQSKSLMFGYSDSRVKNWAKVKKFMENKQLHIVNTAKFISQGLTFDLPSLDKNIQLLDNQISSLKRKIDMNNNSIFQLEKQQINQRNRLKVDSSKQIQVADEIPRLIREVPKLFQEVQQNIKNLKQIVTKYKSFCKNMNGETTLTTLQYFIQNGNQFLKNYEGGQAKVQTHNKYQDFIDWKPANIWGIQIQGIQNQKTIKQITILEHRKTRGLLLQNLNQLMYFYKGIKYELSLKISSFNEEGSLNLVQSEVENYLQRIQSIIQSITGDISTRIQMKNDCKIYQILLKKFRAFSQNRQQMQDQIKQFKIQIQEMNIKREQMVQELTNLRRRLVDSKNKCQKYLTDLIKRDVKIKGQINKLE